MNLFRDLSPEEEKEFRNWANEHYQLLSPIKGIWHPVVQNECVKMNEAYWKREKEETCGY